MLIDFSDYGSIPYEITQIIQCFISELPQKDLLVNMKKPSYNSQVQCALESYIRPYKEVELYENLYRVLDKSEIVCYHATNVLSANQIIQNGILVNDWARYSAVLRSSLIQLGVNEAEADNAVHLVEIERKRKYCDKKGRLCYFANIKKFEDEEVAGYDQFCQNIGGELARWPLKDKMPDVYAALKTGGQAVLIKFALPFSWIPNFERESITAHFIYHFSAKLIWQYDYEIEYDGTLLCDVPSEKILDIRKIKVAEDYD